MKTLLKLSLCIVLLVGLSCKNREESSASSDQPKLRWNLSHTTPPDHPYHIGCTKLAELVKERTQGRFEISVHPSSILGWEREVCEAMQMGTIEISLPAIFVFEMFVPSFQMFNLPFMFKSVEHMQKAFVSPHLETLKADAEKKGFVVLNVGGPVFRYPMNRIRPIEKPKDLVGIKFRAPGVPLMMDTYKAMGAVVTNTNFSELYSALQLGVVDGCENLLTGLYSMRFHEVQKYLSLIPVLNNTVCFTVSKKHWDKLPDNYKQILQEAADESMQVMNEAFLRMESESLAKMKEAGIKVNEPVDLAPFLEATESIRQQYLEKMEPGVAAITKELMHE